MLKIQFKDPNRSPLWVMEKNFSIGSDTSNHLVLDHPSIQPFHAKLLNQGDKFLLRDSNGAGTFVNGQRIKQKPVSCGDLLRFGDIELEIIDPLGETTDESSPYWSLIADSSWLSGQEFPILAGLGETVVVGRNHECNIVFPGTHLSRKHAEIKMGDKTLTVKDLQSANGTFLNDEKIETADVKAGDRLRFDVYSFRVFGPGIQLSKSATHTKLPTITPPPPSSESSTPAQGTPIQAEVKRWKTRPTSPGNREEPTYKSNKALGWLVAIVIIMAFATASLFILNG